MTDQFSTKVLHISLNQLRMCTNSKKLDTAKSTGLFTTSESPRLWTPHAEQAKLMLFPTDETTTQKRCTGGMPRLAWASALPRHYPQHAGCWGKWYISCKGGFGMSTNDKDFEWSVKFNNCLSLRIVSIIRNRNPPWLEEGWTNRHSDTMRPGAIRGRHLTMAATVVVKHISHSWTETPNWSAWNQTAGNITWT